MSNTLFYSYYDDLVKPIINHIIMQEFLHLLEVIWGILLIILFFKIWKMCNNVQKLADLFVGKPNTNASLSSKIAAGDSSAEDALRKQLAIDIEELSKNSVGVTEEDFTRIVGKTPEQAIADLKKQYTELFGKLNKPIPKELEKLHNIEDLWELNA